MSGAAVWILSSTAWAQTSVVLTSSPNPATFGSPVTLTAAVTPATAVGSVTFYDGITIVGTKPVAQGSASISTVLLPAGSRKLTALFHGPATATSNTLTQVVAAAATGSFATQVPIHVLPATPTWVVAGDFNGDGKADFAATGGTGASVVLVGLGNGDGTFRPLTQYTVGAQPGSIAVGDFNGDGIQDLAVLGTTLNILLGTGDGTFQMGASYPGLNLPTPPGSSGSLPPPPPAPFPVPVVVADLNQDGVADLVYGDTIWLGNGDGTFRSQAFPGLIADGIMGSVVTDLNRDGKPDLAVSTEPCISAMLQTVCYGRFYFFSGNGDLTFQSLGTVSLIGPGFSPTTPGMTDTLADLNGDGIPDLVLFQAGALLGYLGTGGGAFGPQINTPVFYGPSLPYGATVVSDFDGDGVMDVAVANGNSNVVVVMKGNGDGTFQQPTMASPNNGSAYSMAAADWNGDGRPDLIVANVDGSISILLGRAPASGLQLTATRGTPQLGTIGFAFPSPLQVTVKDAGGAPVAGAVVIFAVPSSGASATLSSATAITDGFGVASVTATANPVPGAYTVTATVGALSASFSLTNSTAAAASVQATGGTPQSAPAGMAFASPLQVTVRDVFGNPLSGISVSFSAPTSGASASLSSSTAVTNAAGVASVTAIANSTTGSYVVAASVGSLSTSFSLSNSAANGSNLALGKPATQSSTLAGYSTDAAAAAVDGNTDGNFFDGSVTHTNADANAWWQVDLGASASVTSIVIWNRTDCCATRLSDYWVFVSDTPFLASDTPATLGGRANTFGSHQTVSPSPSTNITVNAQGRYVRVQLSGTNNLSLAEVQVFGTPGTPANGTNLAVGRPATQSSTLVGYSSDAASAAVDGNTDGNFFDGSVSHTAFNLNAWWQVDLGTAATVNSITIWNRTDCCATRLSDFWVFVSNTPFAATDTPASLQNRAQTFAMHLTTTPSPSTTISVGYVGQFVRVQLNGTDYLSLAEVQVFGTPGTTGTSNLALGKTATQSSTLAGYATDAASMAVDGNTDGNFFDGSVTHTNADANAWWQVDLGASAAISSITIWNRWDCCVSRLSDYWVFVSDTPFLATDTPATLSTRVGTTAIHQVGTVNYSVTIPMAAQGRYVRVQLSNTDYLSLAEVQVLGQ